MAGSAWTNQVQNQVIIAGTSGQLLVYASTPAANNLIGSISAAGGTDPYGNVYLAGTVNYFHGASGYFAVQMNAGSVFWYHAATEAGPWTGTGEITVDQNGLMVVTATSYKVLVEGDGNSYNMASLTIPSGLSNASPQTVNSTSAATVGTCSATTAAITYRVRAIIQYAGSQAAGTAQFQFGTTGSLATANVFGNASFADAVAGTTGYVARPTALGPFGSPTLSTNNWMVTIDALAAFTTTGAISLQAFCSAAIDPFVIKNAWMELHPLA